MQIKIPIIKIPGLRIEPKVKLDEKKLFTPIIDPKTTIKSFRKAEIKTPAKKIANVSAYNPDPAQTWGDPCIGRWGDNLCELAAKGEKIVASRDLPRGTKVKLGNEIYTVLDTMPKEKHPDKENPFDVFIPIKDKGLEGAIEEARQFGRQFLEFEEIKPITKLEDLRMEPLERKKEPDIFEKIAGFKPFDFIESKVQLAEPGSKLDDIFKASDAVGEAVREKTREPIDKFITGVQKEFAMPAVEGFLGGSLYEKLVKGELPEPIREPETKVAPTVGRIAGWMSAFNLVSKAFAGVMALGKIGRTLITNAPKIAQGIQIAGAGLTIDQLQAPIESTLDERRNIFIAGLPAWIGWGVAGGIATKKFYAWLPTILGSQYASSKLEGKDNTDALKDALTMTAVFSVFKIAELPKSPMQHLKDQAAKKLGIKSKATLDEAKIARNALSQKFHPDKPGGSAKTQAEINNAYDIFRKTPRVLQRDIFNEIADFYRYIRSPEGRGVALRIIQDMPVGLSIKAIGEPPKKPKKAVPIEKKKEVKEIPVTKIPKDLQPLAKEAKKYKSAEEFVEAQSDELIKTREVLARNVKIDSIKPSQFGEDLYNATSRGYAEGHISRFSKPGMQGVETSVNVGKLKRPEQLPAIVVDNSGKIIDGNHRWAAAKMRGLKEISVVTKKQLTDFYTQATKEAKPVSKFLPKELKKPAERKVVTTEEKLLKARVKAEARGAKWGSKVARQKIQDIKKQARDKSATRQELRKSLVKYAKTYLPLRERGKMLARIKNVRTDLGLSRAINLADKFAEKAGRRTLIRQIVKDIKRTKAKKTKGILKGKFTVEAQRKLDAIKDNIKADRDSAREKMAENIEKYQNGKMTYEDMIEANEILSMTGIREMSTDELRSVLDNIRSIRDTGKTIRGVKEFNETTRIQRLKDNFVDIITGKKGIKPGVESVPVGELEARKTVVEKIANWQYGWDNLMDKISKFDVTSEPYQSNISKFGNEIHQARTLQDSGTNRFMNQMQNKAREIFGVKSKRGLNNVFRAMQNEVVDLGTFTNANGTSVSLKMTKEQMMKKYQELQDPTLDVTIKEDMAWTDEMIKAVTGGLSAKEIAWANYQMQFYQDYWKTINKIYSEIYAVDLPRNLNYSPIGRDIESAVPEEVLLAKEASYYASTISGSLKTRVKSRLKLKFGNATGTMISHIIRMEHFKAFAEAVRDMRRVFGDKDVRTAIRQYHGKDILKTIDGYLNDIARDGIDRAKINRGADFLRRNFTKAILGIKPAIALKQVPSGLAYTTEMPIGDYIKGVADFWKNPIKNYKFLVENSSYFRKRFKAGFERDIKAASKKPWAKQLAGTSSFTDHFMFLIKSMDKFAVVQGSWAKYKSEIKAGKTPEQALELAKQATNRTQPSFELESLSPLQKGGSWMKLFTMFQNQPNKYFRIIADNARNFKYGRGNRAKRIYNILLAWVVLPAIFQFMADAFQFKKKHQLRALMLGPLNNLLIAGSIMQSIYGWITDEPFDYQASPVFSTGKDLQMAITKTVKVIENGKNPFSGISINDTIKAIEYYAKATGKLTGLPTPYGVQAEKAIREGKAINFIFSPYSLEKEKKKETEGIKIKGINIKMKGIKVKIPSLKLKI